MAEAKSILEVIRSMKQWRTEGGDDADYERITAEYEAVMQVLREETEKPVFTGVQLIRDVEENLSEGLTETMKDLGLYWS